MKLNDLLSQWDKMEFIGLAPDRDALMCKLNGLDLRVEYLHRVSETCHTPYVSVFLVHVDKYGRRQSLRSNTYGCWGDERKEFFKWFADKAYHARQLERSAFEAVEEQINKMLSDEE
jgi:hypothetical protein